MVELRFKEKQLNDLRDGINRWRSRPDLMQPLEKGSNGLKNTPRQDPCTLKLTPFDM